MGKKCNLKLYNIKIKIKIGIQKPITLIRGSNVGYDLTEIKNVETQDLKNILNLIYSYFTKRSRQKKKNSNFRDLYLRVKKELKEREAPIFKPEPSPVYHPQEKPTSIYEVFIPEFFNDKKFNNNNNNNNSDILKILNEEEQLRDEIEKLKIEKMNLMCEILGKNNKNEEHKKDDKIILDKDINNNNNLNNFINNVNFSNNNFDINLFKINEQLYEDNSFINPLKFPLDIKLENAKMFLDENYYLKY